MRGRGALTVCAAVPASCALPAPSRRPCSLRHGLLLTPAGCRSWVGCPEAWRSRPASLHGSLADDSPPRRPGCFAAALFLPAAAWAAWGWRGRSSMVPLKVPGACAVPQSCCGAVLTLHRAWLRQLHDATCTCRALHMQRAATVPSYLASWLQQGSGLLLWCLLSARRAGNPRAARARCALVRAAA